MGTKRIHTILAAACAFLGSAFYASGADALSAGDLVPVRDMGYEDAEYLRLYETTVASKNRMLKKTRLASYEAPVIRSYTVKPREDIWNIIAKTSLNIDSIATLNRFDFIGMVRQDVTVYLPGTLGLFFEAEGLEGEGILQARTAAARDAVGTAAPVPPETALARRYGVRPEEVLTVSDPVKPGGLLYFVPEVELHFLERSYLTGVVFRSPLVGMQTSGYGTRVDPFVNETAFHGGVDIAASEGKTVRASRWGTVVYAGERNGYGSLVILRHELGYHTLYGHLGAVRVAAGENVETGQALGTVGTTGRTTGPHLHFEIRRSGKPLNPEHIPFLLEHE
jgi:murein DD-endopeptidase MepM/ murein hydrolase activator NlpD